MDQRFGSDSGAYVNGLVNFDWVDGSDLEDESDHDDDLIDTEQQIVKEQSNVVLDGGSCEQQERAPPLSMEEQSPDQVTIVNELGLPVAPRYYDWKTYFPGLKTVLDNCDAIVEEMTNMTKKRWTPWPEYKLYQAMDQAGDWKVIPFMHTFPAYEESRKRVIESNCAACPKMMEILQNLPGIRTILFSRLGPETRLSAHQGWADLANYVLRVHLPLVVPDPTKYPKSCGMWVEGQIKFHEKGDFLVFDDSKFHKAFNASPEERIILIMDFIRPEVLPKGLATGGHTEQLDHFIQEYQRSIGVFE